MQIVKFMIVDPSTTPLYNFIKRSWCLHRNSDGQTQPIHAPSHLLRRPSISYHILKERPNLPSKSWKIGILNFWDSHVDEYAPKLYKVARGREEALTWRVGCRRAAWRAPGTSRWWEGRRRSACSSPWASCGTSIRAWPRSSSPRTPWTAVAPASTPAPPWPDCAAAHGSERGNAGQKKKIITGKRNFGGREARIRGWCDRFFEFTLWLWSAVWTKGMERSEVRTRVGTWERRLRGDGTGVF